MMSIQNDHSVLGLGYFTSDEKDFSEQQVIQEETLRTPQENSTDEILVSSKGSISESDEEESKVSPRSKRTVTRSTLTKRTTNSRLASELPSFEYRNKRVITSGSLRSETLYL